MNIKFGLHFAKSGRILQTGRSGKLRKTGGSCIGCVTAGPCHWAVFGISLFQRSLDSHQRFADLIFFFNNRAVYVCGYVYINTKLLSESPLCTNIISSGSAKFKRLYLK